MANEAPKRVRDQQINFRVSGPEAAAFKAAADSVGLPLGTWLRLIARKAAGLPIA